MKYRLAILIYSVKQDKIDDEGNDSTIQLSWTQCCLSSVQCALMEKDWCYAEMLQLHRNIRMFEFEWNPHIMQRATFFSLH